MKQPILRILMLTLFALPLLAQAGQAEYEQMLAKAEAAHEKAGVHQWQVTTSALNKAKAAAAEAKYGEALAFAQEAHKLAERSIEQGQQQKTAWQNAIVR